MSVTCTVPPEFTRRQRFGELAEVQIDAGRFSWPRKPDVLRGKSDHGILDDIGFETGLKKLDPTQLRPR